MRKRGLLLVLFICLNLVFTSVVMSEGRLESDVSNISPIVAINTKTADNVQSSELVANTEKPVATASETAVNDSETEKSDTPKGQPSAVSNVIEKSNESENNADKSTVGKSDIKPASKPVINSKFDIKTGTVQLSYKSLSNARLKVLIEKDGIRYQYNLRNDGVSEYFPLQLGNGEYSVSILENTEGSKYRYISTQIVKLNLANENEVFLNSNQQINWSYSSNVAQKALELTSDLNSDEAKISAIYEFITANFVYDYDRYNNVPSTYLPDVDSILAEKKGICYDYSALLAAMLRSIGIETKLIKGYTENVTGYHSWNEVYNKETGEWLIIDTTYDSAMLRSGKTVEMSKSSSSYTKNYEF